MKNLTKTGFGICSFWRGGAPKSMNDLLQLHAQGVRTIISLQTGFADALGDYPAEDQHCATLGIAYHSVKCSNFWAPTEEQTEKVMELMGTMPAGKVYLHCFSGVDRTGWMSAAFLLRKGHYHNAREAWEWEAWRKGTHKWFFWWKWLFLHRFS